MRVGVAYLFLTAATLRAFGADAVRECLGVVATQWYFYYRVF